MFCYALLCVHSSIVIILKRKRKLVALLLLSYRCIVTINVLWLFLTVPWVGLQYVIVVFPDHSHLLFAINLKRKRKLVALHLLSYRCIVTINVLWLFLTVPWVGLQYVIVVFPDHSHLLFANNLKRKRKLVALHLLSYRCIVTRDVRWLFLTMPWVGLQCVIVVFTDHTHFFGYSDIKMNAPTAFHSILIQAKSFIVPANLSMIVLIHKTFQC